MLRPPSPSGTRGWRGRRRRHAHDAPRLQEARRESRRPGRDAGRRAGHGKLKNPPAPRWDDLDQAQEAAQLAALREWVNGVLRAQYPDTRFPAAGKPTARRCGNSATSAPNGSASTATRAAPTSKPRCGSTSGGYPAPSPGLTSRSTRTQAAARTATAASGKKGVNPWPGARTGKAPLPVQERLRRLRMGDHADW